MSHPLMSHVFSSEVTLATVLDKGPRDVAVISGSTHSPNVIGRDGCHTVKEVVIRSNILAGDYTPLRPVPVFYQCLEHAIVVNNAPHRPDIIRGDGSCLY
jgi:hypothetical protein